MRRGLSKISSPTDTQPKFSNKEKETMSSAEQGKIDNSYNQTYCPNINHFDEVVPVVLPPVLFVFRTMAVTFGIPIQLLVAVVILKTRQLHTPRNAFWLGNITCHFAILLMGIFEYWAVIISTTNPLSCRIYFLLAGTPYTSLLMSLLLATADRWFAISNPIKHRKYVTVAGVAGCLVVSWLLVFFILTSPYWTGRVPFPEPCKGLSLNPQVTKWVTISHFVLAVLIIAAQIPVYVKTRQYLRHEMAGDLNQKSNNSTLNSHPDEYFVHLPDKTICRLELEASVTLLCGVVSLMACALPLAFVFLTLIVCKIGFEALQCDLATILALIPYAREMLLLHSVISPLLYILRSREFAKALRRKLPFCFRPLRIDSPIELL
jgi:hypothetical protein